MRNSAPICFRFDSVRFGGSTTEAPPPRLGPFRLQKVADWLNRAIGGSVLRESGEDLMPAEGSVELPLVDVLDACRA